MKKEYINTFLSELEVQERNYSEEIDLTLLESVTAGAKSESVYLSSNIMPPQQELEEVFGAMQSNSPTYSKNRFEML